MKKPSKANSKPGLFSRLWRKRKPAEEEKKSEEKPAKKPLSAEEELKLRMASKATTLSFFVEACKKRKMDPGITFLRYYAKLKDNPKVLKRHIKAASDAQDAKKRFSLTEFYAKIIVEILERKQ